MKNKTPLVSVVMPVRNAGDFLTQAIDSILKQTYKSLELIIIDDASSDETPKILASYKDKRIKLFKNKQQLGVTGSANLGISEATGEYVARMDGDDIASEDRIEKQVKFLLKNKKTVAVGGQCDLIDKNGIKFGEKKFPTSDKNIRNMIFSSVPLQQPTLVVNQALLPKDFVWYDEDYSSAEELELLFKLFKFGKVRNLPDKVLKYRIHDKNTSLINPKRTFYLTLKTRLNAIVKYGYTPTLKGILITLVQAVFISLVPSSWIYPIYSHLRGMRRLSWRGVRMGWNVNDTFKKAFSMAKA